MRIYLNTEIRARELEANLYVAMVAAHRGHTSFIFDQRLLPMLARRAIATGSILHTKSLQGEVSYAALLGDLVRRGVFITSLDQEFPVFRRDVDLRGFLEERFSEKTIRLASRIFTWGKDDFLALESRFDLKPPQLVLGGAARADLWREKLLSLPSGYESWKSQKFILVSSNLSTNSHYRSWEIVQGLRDGGYLEKNPRLRHEFFKELSKSTLLLDAYVDLLERISLRFPELQVVVRPHPTEDFRGWSTIAEHLPNVHVISAGSLTAWIQHATLLIQNNCTSGVEASFSGVPVVSFQPSSSPLEESIGAQGRVGVQCGDVETVVSQIRQLLENGGNGVHPQATESPDWLSDRVHSPKTTQTQILIEEWEKIDNLEPTASNLPVGSIIKFFVYGSASTVINALRRLWSIARNRPAFTLDKFPPVRAKALKDDVIAISKRLDTNRTVRVFRLSAGAF